MSITDALDAVEKRLQELDPRIGGEDPLTLLSRVHAGAAIVSLSSALVHERAVNLAAMSLLLVSAIERAETTRFETGEAA